jgi:autotransporter-associated beta strand protein
VSLTTNVTLEIDGSYAPALGEQFLLVDNLSAEPVAGEFSGLPEGAVLTPFNSRLYRISYRGGDGNDISITAIPAPHVWDGADPSERWSVAANWLSNAPPAAGDGMVFPAFVAALTPTNDFPAYTRFESLTVSNDYTFYGNAVELTGGFTIDGSAIFNPAARLASGQVWNVRSNFIVNGAVDLTTNLLNFYGGGTVLFSNNLTGTTGGVMCLNGLAALSFNGSNNFSGPMRMLGGALTNNGQQFNTPLRLEQADWTVGPSALLSNSAVAFSGGVSNVAAFSGVMLNGSLAVTGGVFTVGPTAVVSNSPTTLAGGTLSVLGQMPASPITLLGGTLAGTGVVANVTASGGTISPGASPGRLRTGNLALGTGVTLDMQIAGSVAGVNYDQVQVTGSVNLNGATLLLSLVDQTLNIGDTVVLIDNDGAEPIVGTFAGFPEGTTFPLGLLDVRITYLGGTGNDVVLTVVSKIPRATWTGLGDTNDWATATNWARSTPPLDGDSLYFPAVATNLANFNSLGSTSYATIFLGGSNYMIQAGNVVLTGGIMATNPVGTNWVDSVLPGPSSVISNTAGNTLILTGTYQDSLLNLQVAGSLELRGNLAGGSNVVMAGNGTLHIYNTNPPFRGNVILQSGLTEANTTNSFGFAAANSVSISNGATLVLKAAGEYSSRFFIGGTQHVATAGTVIVDGDNVLTAPNSSYLVDDGASLTLNGLVSGAFGLRKDGAGEMTLVLTNSYTGGTFVNGGTLYVAGLVTNALRRPRSM